MVAGLSAKPAPCFARYNHAGHQEAPETNDDQHQADTSAACCALDVVGRTIGVEFADAWPKVDQDTQRKEASNRVHKARSAKVMDTELVTIQPSACQPQAAATTQANEPSTTARMIKPTVWIRSITAPDMIEAVVAANRCKGTKEDARRLVCDVWTHVLCAFAPAPCDGIGVFNARNACWTRCTGNTRWEAPIDPPTKEVECWDHKGEGQNVFHTRRQNVLERDAPIS